MPDFLRVTVRFLQPYSHGRGGGGEPEWPPSPLRLFQALVAASAARWNERMRVEYAAPALAWLEGLARPDIVAPAGVASDNPYRLYVPDNVADKVAKSWSRGGEGSIAEYRTEKDVRPTHLTGDALHYLFPLAGPDDLARLETHLPVLRAAASSITHLGWGVDQAVGEAGVVSRAEAEKLAGDRWRPVAAGGVPLRVPEEGTLTDLSRKHAEFLGRLEGGGFRPVAPLGRFAVVGYHSATAAVPGGAPARPVAAFEIHPTVESRSRGARGKFHSFRAVYAHIVAGMVRHAAAAAARKMGMDEARVRSFVEGHGAEEGSRATTDDRLTFLPLPSITPVGVEAIRRVLVVGPAGCDLGAVSRRLDGSELIDEGTKLAVAALALVSAGDRNFGRYVGESAAWSTVTPLVLPGFDDPCGLRRKLRAAESAGSATAAQQRAALGRVDARAVDLIRKSLLQAGVAPELAASAEVEYRAVGFRPGVGLAREYESSLRYPRCHVRVRFARPVRGPLSAGAGRYRGLGLFARD